MKKFRVLTLGLALSLLSACTFYVTPGSDAGQVGVRSPSEIITQFEPTRGAGAYYRLGETISFRVVVTRDGYLTLTSYNPDGSVDVFGRNIPVRGGVVNLIPSTESRVSYELAPPRGLQRIRAAFTPAPTDPNRVTYQGTGGEGVWTEMIEDDLEPYAQDARDVAETTFFIR